MDPVELRVEKVRITLDHASRTVELHARRHVAVIAVLIAMVGSVVVAWLIGQLGTTPASALMLAVTFAIARELLALLRLGAELARSTRQALQDIDTLIWEQEDTEDDGETETQP